MADKSRVHSLVEKAMNQSDDSPKKFSEPSKKRPDPSGNLGKFLHPSKSPKSPVNNGAKDVNSAGSKVIPGF